MDATSASARPPRGMRTLLFNWGPTLMFSVIFPFVTYSWLTGDGVGQAAALLISGAWPIVELVVFFVLHRRIDELSMLILVFMALGVLSFVAFNSPRMLLIKDSALTGLMGLAFLLSMALPRPLTFYFGRKFGTNGTAGAVAEWNGLWRHPAFRRTQYVIAVVWGVAFLAEAGLRIALTFVLPTSTMVAVNAVLPFVLVTAVVLWTVRYGKRARARGEARRAAAVAEDGAHTAA